MIIAGRMLFAKDIGEKRGSWDGGIEASKIDRATASGEIHTDGLAGMKRLEAAFIVVEARLSISDKTRFFREVKTTLRIVVIFCTRADNICV